jgi:hypothetical protein
MLHRALAVLLLLAASNNAFAVSGYAHGTDHCYYFDAPRGWTMDNKAGAQDGVPMVFYPNGTTWQSAPVAIYTRPISSSPGRPDTTRITEQVDQVIQMYLSGSESIKAARLREVSSRSGAHGELWQYTGYSNGGAELAVYFPAAKTVNFFVMQVPRAASVGQFLPALVELAESYRVAAECKPCSGSSACTGSN